MGFSREEITEKERDYTFQVKQQQLQNEECTSLAFKKLVSWAFPKMPD